MGLARQPLLLLLVGAGACSQGAAGLPSDLAGVHSSGDAGDDAGDDAAVPITDLAGADLLRARSPRPFPDTSRTIAILADQLPGGLTAAQQQFVVAHFAGTQKLTLDLSRPLRALKPDFLVLHYHLAIWQSAEKVTFILDGKSWSNDYPTVTAHEGWFWHNPLDQRVASHVDGKWLMNLADPSFARYWADSLAAQVDAGDYDAVFADSASPALLQWETQDGSGRPQDPRLAGTGAKDSPIAEWGGKTYIQGWQTFIANLDAELAARGIPLLPNTGAFVTTWDSSDYGLTAGFFSEGFADPAFSPADWKASTDRLIQLIAGQPPGREKIAILQSYLDGADDLHKRRYYLANYLLVKGSRTYLDYFARGPLEWYPEWGLDLGAPVATARQASDYFRGGVYQRAYEKGLVLVNPSGAPVRVQLPRALRRVEPAGGGAVDATGTAPGSISTTVVDAIDVPAASAEILIE